MYHSTDHWVCSQVFRSRGTMPKGLYLSKYTWGVSSEFGFYLYNKILNLAKMLSWDKSSEGLWRRWMSLHVWEAWLICWSAFKMAFNNSHLCKHVLVGSLSVFNQDWSVWPREYGRHASLTSWFLWLSLGEARCHAQRHSSGPAGSSTQKTTNLPALISQSHK